MDVKKLLWNFKKPYQVLLKTKIHEEVINGVSNEMNIKLSDQSSIIDLSVLNLIETIKYDSGKAFNKGVLGNSQLINFKI